MSGRKRPTATSGAFPIEDIEESVYRHILVVAHVWPGITPMNVWDMRYDFWVGFADAAEKYAKDQTKSTKKEGGRRGR
jgi:hypothetical protein